MKKLFFLLLTFSFLFSFSQDLKTAKREISKLTKELKSANSQLEKCHAETLKEQNHYTDAIAYLKKHGCCIAVRLLAKKDKRELQGTMEWKIAQLKNINKELNELEKELKKKK